MADKAPDLNTIKEMKTYAERHWKDWREQAQTDYDYFRDGVPKYEFNIKMGPNSNYIAMRPAKARQLVISAVTQLLANPIRFTVDKLVPLYQDEPTTKAESEADYAESLLEAIVYHTSRKSGNTDPLRASAVSMFITGMGALETGYDERGNPRPLKARKDSRAHQRWLAARPLNFPVYIQSLDPLTLLPSPDDGESWVIKTFERTGWEIQALYPHWTPPDANDPHWKSKNYKFLTYCDHRWYVYGTEDDTVAVESREHFMSKVPIVIWPSGLGDDNGSPEMRYRGLYTDTRKSKALVALARAMSQVDATNANFAWAVAFYNKKWGHISFNPGTVNELDIPEGIKISEGVYLLQGMTAPQGLYAEVQRLEDQIHNEVLSEAIGTGDVPASDPTSKTIRRINEAASRLSWSRVYTEQAWERLAAIILNALRSKDLFGSDERFALLAPQAGPRSITKIVNVSRDKIPEAPIIRATISPESDQEKFAKVQAGLAMFGQGEGPLDPWTFLEEYAGFRDGGQRVMERKMRYRILNALSEAAVQTAVARATGQVGPEISVRDTINAMQQGDQIAEQAAGGQAGPPVPGSPADTTSMLAQMNEGMGGIIGRGLRGRQGMRSM